MRKRFAAAMMGAAPNYHAEPRGPAPNALPGEAAWATPTKRTWIVLVPSLKGYNEFTVEVGWSARGRYPEVGGRPLPVVPSPARTEWTNPEGWLRISSLDARYPEWWRLGEDGDPTNLLAAAEAATRPLSAEEAERAAEQLVPNAIAAVRAVAVPYLEEWLTRNRGIDG